MEEPCETGDSEGGEATQTVRTCITEIDRIREKMMSDQDEIDRLKLETREILVRLKAR